MAIVNLIALYENHTVWICFFCWICIFLEFYRC